MLYNVINIMLYVPTKGMEFKMKEKRNLLIAGGTIGLLAIILVKLGNPANMGFCIACFLRDIAGGIGLHRAEVVQYIRPEIIGVILGSFLIAVGSKEFQAKGGSSPVLRFVLGFIVMVGALMFLGCPLRMILRIAGGDLNAIIGLAGFVCGILVGVFFLNNGFSLKRTYTVSKLDGYTLPVISVILLAMLLAGGAGVLIFSESGPGSMHAPIAAALAAGLIVGVVGQKSRLCMAGGIRDVFLFKDWTLLSGFIAILVVTLIGNVATGAFKLGFIDQPVAHTDGVWNFLGLLAVGFASVLLGGCPMRQLILAGEGNSDSVITIFGMVVGAAICHNFGLASSAKGPTANGKIALIAGIAVLVLIAVFNSSLVKSDSPAKSEKAVV